MKKTSVLALAAVFVIGAASALGYQVHAQSVVAPAAPQAAVQVQTTQQDPANTDGETADDAAVSATGTATVDAADTGESATETADTNEAPDAAGASDANEVETAGK